MTFSTWGEVLEYARTGAPLFYKAPLDYRAARLFQGRPEPWRRGAALLVAHYVVRARSIRIWPPGSTGRGRVRTSDPFTADAGHLDRFSSHPVSS